MTSKTLIPVTSDDLTSLAFNANADIEIDTANSRAYLRLAETTFVAELTQEPTC